MPIDNFKKYFAALQVARVFLRERKLLELRILTVQDGTVALATFVYESHDQRLSSLATPLSRTRMSYENY